MALHRFAAGILALGVLLAAGTAGAATAGVATTGAGSTGAITGASATSGAPVAQANQNAGSSVAQANRTVETVPGNGSGASASPDPQTDVSGWENGYWYDESANVTQEDGLTAAELDRWTSLAQAHVEHLTGREFAERVTVEVLTPEEAVGRAELRGIRELLSDDRYRAWNDQLAEAKFYRGENATARDPESVTAESLLAGVLGYYDPASDRLVVVRNESERVLVDNATLHHELAHALQDQRYDLTEAKYAAAGTADEVAGVRGIVEGHATHVELRYAEACADGRFRCVETPDGAYAPANEIFRGLPPFATSAQPYTDGAALVADLRRRGGEAAIDAAFENPPVSTEQTIHPERYPRERPAALPASGVARGGWTTFDVDWSAGDATDVTAIPLGENGTERVGELGLFGLFAYQTVVADADAIDLGSYATPDGGRYDVYDYSSQATSGWGNDRLTPYRKATENGTEYGYVWETTWDTADDARQFRTAYRRVLASKGARRTDDRTYVVSDGPFADAFAVVLDGRRVTIVNGPTRADLAAIRPGLVDANETRDHENGRLVDANGLGTE